MTLTPTLRLTEPAPLGDDGVWATYLNNDLVYIDRGINGLLSKSIAGLTSYTLLADGSASDEARYQVYTFTGALAADCTVTIPANAKVGMVRNSTTGGFNVIVTTGSGPATIPPDGYFYHLLTSGSGVGTFNLGVTGGMNVAGTLKAGGLTLSGPISVTNVTASGTLSVTGASTLAAVSATTGTFSGAVTALDGTSGDQVVNYSQFASSIGASGYTYLPNGALMQWGRATTDGSGLAPIVFPVPFGSTDYSIVETHVVPSPGSGGSITSAIVSGTETASGVTLQAYVGGSASTSRPLRWIALGDG